MKIPLQSPWVEQINRTRPLIKLENHTRTGIAIVGGGISGAVTAYFLLKKTRRLVSLVEADLVAHGATGHNAGQLATYFERTFSDLVDEFGLEMAADAQNAVHNSWNIISQIISDLNIDITYHVFEGYAGCVDANELVVHLKGNALRDKAGVQYGIIYVADNAKDLAKIPKRLRKYYKLVPKSTISDLLQTKDRKYIAALTSKKGCLNSALFTEKIISSLVKKYPYRFRVFEKSRVAEINLYAKRVILKVGKLQMKAKKVVLCTNGFEKFKIINHAGDRINDSFHRLVKGTIGYMAGYVEEPQLYPTAISYLPKGLHVGNENAQESEPYFYVTRRPDPYPDQPKGQSSLLCIGGPEAILDDCNKYLINHPYPREAKAQIEKFLQKNYRHGHRKIKLEYFWHGLMGYTPNGLRCIGPDPRNKRLIYNLGCNGVGLMTAMFGAERIAKLIRGEKLKPSIFDPEMNAEVFTENKESIKC
jgi:glycine/D-amino acid oxidase-like deaminating enzyme